MSKVRAARAASMKRALPITTAERPVSMIMLSHELTLSLQSVKGREARANVALPIVLEALDRAWDYVSIVHKQTTTPATQERAALLEADIRAIRRQLASWR